MPLRKRGTTHAEFHEMPTINLREADTGIYDNLRRIDAHDSEVEEGVVDLESTEIIPSNALLYQEDGSIVHQRFRITPTGLDLPDDLTDEEWAGIGRVIKTIESAGMWAAGDWAAHAVKTWDVKYEDIAAQFDYRPETLESYASVARNVPKTRRNPRLSFSHHRLVSKLHPSKQERALEKAFDDQGKPLSISAFRAALNGRTALPSGTPKTTMGKFNARLTRFSEQQIALAKNAKPGERRNMAEMLRRLAATIEGLE